MPRDAGWLRSIGSKGPAPGLRLRRSNTLLATTVEPAFRRAARRKGLLGRAELPAGHAMIIAPCSAVHTFFMRFPIDVLFVNRAGRIVKVRERMSPFRIAFAVRAFAV